MALDFDSFSQHLRERLRQQMGNYVFEDDPMLAEIFAVVYVCQESKAQMIAELTAFAQRNRDLNDAMAAHVEQVLKNVDAHQQQQHAQLAGLCREAVAASFKKALDQGLQDMRSQLRAELQGPLHQLQVKMQLAVWISAAAAIAATGVLAAALWLL